LEGPQISPFMPLLQFLEDETCQYCLNTRLVGVNGRLDTINHSSTFVSAQHSTHMMVPIDGQHKIWLIPCLTSLIQLPPPCHAFPAAVSLWLLRLTTPQHPRKSMLVTKHITLSRPPFNFRCMPRRRQVRSGDLDWRILSVWNGLPRLREVQTSWCRAHAVWIRKQGINILCPPESTRCWQITS
jgi:hypothetical protein